MSSYIGVYVKNPVTDFTLIAEQQQDQVAIVSLYFGYTDHFKHTLISLGESPLLLPHEKMISGFLDGACSDLSAIPIALTGYTEFQKKVLLCARTIPRGTVWSYSKLAEQSGFPHAVRATASVMRNNPLPLIIPCHRVIRKDKTIGGFAGQSHGNMVDLKKRLLDLESGIGDFARIS